MWTAMRTAIQYAATVLGLALIFPPLASAAAVSLFPASTAQVVDTRGLGTLDCDLAHYNKCSPTLTQYAKECVETGPDPTKIRECLDFFFGSAAETEYCCPCIIFYASRYNLPALATVCSPPPPPPPAPASCPGIDVDFFCKNCNAGVTGVCKGADPEFCCGDPAHPCSDCNQGSLPCDEAKVCARQKYGCTSAADPCAEMEDGQFVSIAACEQAARCKPPAAKGYGCASPADPCTEMAGGEFPSIAACEQSELCKPPSPQCPLATGSYIKSCVSCQTTAYPDCILKCECDDGTGTHGLPMCYHLEKRFICATDQSFDLGNIASANPYQLTCEDYTRFGDETYSCNPIPIPPPPPPGPQPPPPGPPAPPGQVTWVLGGVGQNCNTVCASLGGGRSCSEDPQVWPATRDEFNMIPIVSPFCETIRDTQGPGAPIINPNTDTCYWKRSTAAPWCPTKPAFPGVADQKRFCPCA